MRVVREPRLDHLGTMKPSRARAGIHRAKATLWELVTRKETISDQGLAQVDPDSIWLMQLL